MQLFERVEGDHFTVLGLPLHAAARLAAARRPSGEVTRMFVIGLTGSIAMGKTTTARLFAEEGVPVHDADAAVHRLYEGEAVALIEAAFPGATRDGKVDRAALGKQVVGKPQALRRLEEIVHPLVREAETKFLQEAEHAGAKVVVLDIPLLFETGGETASMRRWWCRRRTRCSGRGCWSAASAWSSSRRCWRGRCPMRKSAGAPISWWIAGRASSTRARRCGKSWRRLLRCRSRRK